MQHLCCFPNLAIIRRVAKLCARKFLEAKLTTLSNRSAVEPFHAMDVLAEANRRRAAGHPIISMAVGQPADSAPVVVRQAAERALKDGRIGYTTLWA